MFISALRPSAPSTPGPVRRQAHGDCRRPPGTDSALPLLERHAVFVAGLECNGQAKRLRLNGAERLLARHPDLGRWMGRPTVDRVAEARRLYAWPFLSWCFAVGALRPDVELLAAKSKGAHYATWARMHPDQVSRVAETASAMGWVDEWVYRLSTTALATVCMTRQTSLDQITVEDLAAVRADIDAAVAVLPRCRATLRGLVHSLHTVCYQLGVLDVPPGARQRPPHHDRAADGDRQPTGHPGCVRPLPADRGHHAEA